MAKFFGRREGFTIIELIVVIAIITVLAAIIMPNVTIVKQKGNDSAIKNEMNQFYVLATQYYQSHGNYAAMFTRNNSDLDAIAVQALYDKLPAFQNCKTTSDKDYATGWAVCAVLNIPVDQTIAWCADNSGAKTEICADQCKTSALAPGSCPAISPPCHAPTGPNSCL